MTAPHVKGKVVYQPYDAIEDRIKAFSNVETIGKDASGAYDMYVITLGNKEKPSILITAAAHGVEWQSAQYSLAFFEKLERNTYPDQAFRNHLLKNYQLIYIPVVNPHGVDKIDDIQAPTDLRFYKNANDVDVNRDFTDQSQQETKNVVNIMKTYKPFAHLDCHLYQPTYDTKSNMIIGNEHEYTKAQQNQLADKMETCTNQSVTKWTPRPNRDKMVRGYTGRQGNSHTPITLSLLAELVRPAVINGELVQRLTDENIYNYGNAFLHYFFEIADEYYLEESE